MSQYEASKVSEVRYFGLKHQNGYVREFGSLEEAQEVKAGTRRCGRHGEWKDHTLVERIVVVYRTEWTPVDEATR